MTSIKLLQLFSLSQSTVFSSPFTSARTPYFLPDLCDADYNPHRRGGEKREEVRKVVGDVYVHKRSLGKVRDSDELLEKIAEFEKSHNVKVIEASVRDGEAVVTYVLMPTIIGEELTVSVWNCSATLFYGDDSEEKLAKKCKLSEKQMNAIDLLKYYIIEAVNGGAINFSGIYYGDQKSLRWLKRILESEEEAEKVMEEIEKAWESE